MENREIGLKKENLLKVTLNEEGDFILINDTDTAIFDKFANFIQWLETKSSEMEERTTELKKKHGNSIVKFNSEGDIEDVNVTAYLEFSQLRKEMYGAAAERIDGIFGSGTIRKYFKIFYELNSDFVPDDECLYDFMEEITPILNDLFSDRKTRIDTKYSRFRNGGKKTKYRRK